ncbi:hypothetical protein PHET_04619 [Paragonimus heterotremus]|uniref:Uncharacterized protein n=1 Tax=Paragonimus heterotremus TaxID=100268 RepID=A0A8J4TFV1_9TREM|nr:hypothetical protein PHET_04619 [Paragonimus heterotremus]
MLVLFIDASGQRSMLVADVIMFIVYFEAGFVWDSSRVAHGRDLNRIRTSKLASGNDWDRFVKLRRDLTKQLDREHPNWHVQALKTLCENT